MQRADGASGAVSVANMMKSGCRIGANGRWDVRSNDQWSTKRCENARDDGFKLLNWTKGDASHKCFEFTKDPRDTVLLVVRKEASPGLCSMLNPKLFPRKLIHIGAEA